MGLPNCLFNPSKPFVLDASVAINLNATGNYARILAAIPNPVVVLDVVAGELEAGRKRGRSDADFVSTLVSMGRAEVVSLCGECEGNFLAMVCGSGSATLDDGEAATIAWAVAHGGIPIIDEKKGIAICPSNTSGMIGADRFNARGLAKAVATKASSRTSFS